MLAAAPAVFVSEKSAGVATPATLAVTVYGPPATLLAVKVADVATPLPLEIGRASCRERLQLAAVPGAPHVSGTTATGLPAASFTEAPSRAATPVRFVALCGAQVVAGWLAAARAVFVSEKFAGVATPATLAVTVYGPPATLLAVKVADVATPLPLVVAVFTPPAKLPLAPVLRSVDHTAALQSPLSPASLPLPTSSAA